MSEPLVSVIVPVYKVEAYLDKCVESLVAQDLREIEIILVDDGSPDACPALCDAWAQRDERIRVLHKENGGLSSARNAGVAIARAPYVGFVDSDDYVEPSMYRILYENIINTGADLSICNLNSCYSNKTVVHNEGELRTVSAQEALKHTLLNNACAVLRLYPIELAKKVPFPIGKTSEDAFTGIDFFCNVEKVVLDPRPLYYWWHREGSISSTSKHAMSLDVIDAYTRTLEIVQQRFPDITEVAQFRQYWAYFNVLDKIILNGSDADAQNKAMIVAWLRKNSVAILGNNYVGRGRKLAMRFLNVSVFAYSLFVRVENRRLSLN